MFEFYSKRIYYANNFSTPKMPLFCLCFIDDTWKQIAKTRFDETDENRQYKIDQFYQHLNRLRESKKVGQNILENIPTLSVFPSNAVQKKDYNHFLLKFLRAGNHDIDYATQILLNYIRQFNIGPKYTKNVLNMDVIRRVYEDKIGTLLPHRDKYGRRVYFYRPGKWDPDTVCLDDCYCAGYMLCEAAAREPMSQVCGVTVICDAANFGFKQLRQFSIEDIKAFSTFMQVFLFYCARYLNKELFNRNYKKRSQI